MATTDWIMLEFETRTANLPWAPAYRGAHSRRGYRSEGEALERDRAIREHCAARSVQTPDLRVMRRPGGYLSDAQLVWLRQLLDGAERVIPLRAARADEQVMRQLLRKGLAERVQGGWAPTEDALDALHAAGRKS